MVAVLTSVVGHSLLVSITVFTKHTTDTTKAHGIDGVYAHKISFQSVLYSPRIVLVYFPLSIVGVDQRGTQPTYRTQKLNLNPNRIKQT